MSHKLLWANLYTGNTSSISKRPNTDSLSCRNQPHFPAQPVRYITAYPVSVSNNFTRCFGLFQLHAGTSFEAVSKWPQIFTLTNSMSPHPPWIISISKISCFQCHAATYPVISHSVSVCVFLCPPLLFFPPSLTHFHSLWYCSVNIKWAPSFLLIPSQAQMISLRECGWEWQLPTTAGWWRRCTGLSDRWPLHQLFPFLNRKLMGVLQWLGRQSFVLLCR